MVTKKIIRGFELPFFVPTTNKCKKVPFQRPENQYRTKIDSLLVIYTPADPRFLHTWEEMHERYLLGGKKPRRRNIQCRPYSEQKRQRKNERKERDFPKDETRFIEDIRKEVPEFKGTNYLACIERTESGALYICHVRPEEVIYLSSRNEWVGQESLIEVVTFWMHNKGLQAIVEFSQKELIPKTVKLLGEKYKIKKNNLYPKEEVGAGGI